MTASAPLSKTDLSDLPDRHLLVLAARAALRVMPVTGRSGDFKFWGRKAAQLAQDVEAVVRLATGFATRESGWTTARFEATITSTEEAADAANSDPPAEQAVRAAVAVAHLVRSIPNRTGVVAVAAAVLEFAANAAHGSAPDDLPSRASEEFGISMREAVTAAARFDFDRLMMQGDEDVVAK